MRTEAERHWRRRAGWTVFRYNFGWWLSLFLPAATILSAVFACGVLIFRGNGLSIHWAWPVYLAVLLGAGVGVFFRARKKFFGIGDGLVRLDVNLGLRNRLTAAAAGIGSYPAVQSAGDGFSWRPMPIVAPLLGCILVVATALLIPVPGKAGARVFAEPPPSWQELETWVEALKESEVTQPEALRDVERKLEELRDQARENWYGQSSLEAGDSLRGQTGQSIGELQRNLESAANTLEALQHLGELGDQASASDFKEMAENLGKDIEGLELGNLPLNKELLGQLKNLDPTKLTAAEAKALRQKLRDGASTCAQCLGEGELMALPIAESLSQGAGPVTRGPGTVPLSLNPQSTELGASRTEKLSSEDRSRAMLGEVLGVGKSAHEPDANPPAVAAAGGAVTTTGSGGEAVWRNDLTPDEREILRQFYK